MVTKQDWMPGDPCWIDLFTSDVPRARRFYEAVLGWTSGEQNPEFGGYFMFFLDGEPIAGGMGNPSGGGAPDAWATYLSAPNAQDSLDKAEANGGSTIVGAMPVSDLGTMAVISDPGGAGIGVWAPNQFKGFARYGEPGAPTWFELHTGDYKGSISFYQSVFGWKTTTVQDLPDFRYSTADRQDTPFAGILDATGFLPVGTPSRWIIRFGVADTEAAVAAALANGGSLAQPIEDSPYGKVAHLSDPTGVIFSVISTAG